MRLSSKARRSPIKFIAAIAVAVFIEGSGHSVPGEQE
jgi:hypothetical protein